MNLAWMKSSGAIFGGLLGGAVLGVLSPDFALSTSFLGELYLAFLTMCALPIMAVALVAGVARLFRSRDVGGLVGRIIITFCIALLLVGAVSLFLGVVGQPGAGLTDTVKQAVGEVLVQSLLQPDTQDVDKTSSLAFVQGLVPANVFVAFVEGNTLQILFFSLVFGALLGLTPGETSDQLLALLELIFRVLQQAIGVGLYSLPIALMSIMAVQVANLGPAMLVAMGKFVAYVYATSVFLIGVAAVVVATVYRIPFREQLTALKDTLVIAFGTRSNIAAMPSLMTALRYPLRVPAHLVNLVVPLGLLMCRYSMVVVFTLVLCFLAQLYFIRLGPYDLAILSVGSIVGAVATAGMPTQASLGVLSVVAAPLGIPLEPAIILLLAAGPVMDPVICMLDVYVNGMAGVVISKTKSAQTLLPDRELERTEPTAEGREHPGPPTAAM